MGSWRTSGFEGSHDFRRVSSGDCARDPHACMKPLKGDDEFGGGCRSVVVASDRVSCRGNTDVGGRCVRLESCDRVVSELMCELLRSCAGHSHGGVNWVDDCACDERASLQIFRLANRGIIMKSRGIKRDKEEGKRYAIEIWTLYTARTQLVVLRERLMAT